MSTKLAWEFLLRAKKCLDEAKRHINNPPSPNYVIDYPLSITRAHECVEFSLKAAMLLIGRRRLPHTHDLSDVLTGAIKKFPKWFEQKVPSFALHSKVMSVIKVYATYGYEPTSTPPKDLFREHYANMCIKNAEDVWFNCNRLYHESQSAKS